MSARGKALRGLTPVSAKHHRENGLLRGWQFLYVPQGAGLACSLCGRPARYVVAPNGLPKCARHARDF